MTTEKKPGAGLRVVGSVMAGLGLLGLALWFFQPPGGGIVGWRAFSWLAGALLLVLGGILGGAGSVLGETSARARIKAAWFWLAMVVLLVMVSLTALGTTTGSVG